MAGKGGPPRDANWLREVLKRKEILCYLDIDIDGARAAYQLACEFVAATNLTYGWTSQRLSELGGSEKARLPDMFAADYEWSQKGKIQLEPPVERVVVRVDAKNAPLAAENFVAICDGFKGKSSNTGKPMHYVGCPFHRIVKGFVAQTGDIATGTGAGGESIWGKKFKDDKDGLKTKLDKRGLVGMCNNGKNSNTSQFFFGLAPLPKLTGKHVVFGEIVEGLEVVDAIEAAGTEDTEGKPTVPVIIVGSGVLE
eukprot:m.266499 g.266499  ORF g.266499 m.266499 type:complete len:253 (-) comp16036_c0_seq30:338-1096(-)